MKEIIPHQPPKTVSEPKQEPPISVLLVDDNEDFLIIAKRHLEKHGSFQIETVLSVKEAQQKIAQKQYEVIISDQQMPEKTGLEFLKELRDCGNKTPFILLTGECRDELEAEAKNVGADRYFNKDENPETVYAELVHCLKKALKAKNEKNSP